MKKEKPEKRFEQTSSDSVSLIGPNCSVIVDRQTGVNYLVAYSSYGLGITPLLDSDGKPVVTKTEE
ncbi:MAG TPA: hypothetical protein DEF02_00630 [Clostridiales bacterium]|nr:hypothetical protein [Clostridiales bacterium]HBW05088.1 hypothetical protein [Clostridiales bacterium]HCH92669.1 hypothetical protein [Clostridiales bacterium]